MHLVYWDSLAVFTRIELNNLKRKSVIYFNFISIKTSTIDTYFIYNNQLVPLLASVANMRFKAEYRLLMRFIKNTKLIMYIPKARISSGLLSKSKNWMINFLKAVDWWCHGVSYKTTAIEWSWTECCKYSCADWLRQYKL